MKANQIKPNQIIVSETIPKVFNGIYNYDHLSGERHYADGWREVIMPEINTKIEYLGKLRFDTAADNFTYSVLELTAAQMLNREEALYHKRTKDGMDSYLKESSKLRLLKLQGGITEAQHNAIELTLEPVVLLIVRGQWISAKTALESIGSNQLGEDMYNEFFSQLTNYIELNY